MSVFGIVPSDIANQSLDAIGWPTIIGDLQEGSDEARVLLRHYAPSVTETLRAAHWNFSRRQASLTLLQDQTGNTANVGKGTPGMGLWIYEYAWPIDCVKARYVPVTGNINTPVPSGNIQPPNSSSPTTTLPAPWPAATTLPAPFLVTTDLVPNVYGAYTSWGQQPDINNTQGQSLVQQTVILTNQQWASLVYTSLVGDPNLWDSLFRQALVQIIGAKIALPLWARKDIKVAAAMQQACVAKAKMALDAARVADGNEAPANTNHEAAWIRFRNSGGGWRGRGGGGYDGPGYLWCGWEMAPFPDGSCY